MDYLLSKDCRWSFIHKLTCLDSPTSSSGSFIHNLTCLDSSTRVPGQSRWLSRNPHSFFYSVPSVWITTHGKRKTGPKGGLTNWGQFFPHYSWIFFIWDFRLSSLTIENESIQRIRKPWFFLIIYYYFSRISFTCFICLILRNGFFNRLLYVFILRPLVERYIRPWHFDFWRGRRFEKRFMDSRLYIGMGCGSRSTVCSVWVFHLPLPCCGFFEYYCRVRSKFSYSLKKGTGTKREIDFSKLALIKKGS